MSVLVVLFLALNLGTSGGAIRPVVTFTPNWGNILQGDSVTLTCDMTSTIPEEPQSYEWYKDNQAIPGGQQNLFISPSRVEHSGDYQCGVIGSNISDPVTLNVTNKYLILQRPPSTIYEGDPMSLKCHYVTGFKGYPTRFYKNNKVIKSNIFHVHRADINTDGYYSCTKLIFVEDQIGREVSDSFKVLVKELFSPPKIKVTPYRVKEGDDITVTCDTKLDPLRPGTELQFAFYRDGLIVQDLSVSDTYKVHSAHIKDFGYYNCEAKTKDGKVRKISNEFRIWIYDYTMPNIIRLVISVCVLAAALYFISFHNK